MTDSDAAQLASVLSVDAKYLADCVEQFRAVGEVRIPVTSIKVLIANYQAVIGALGGTVEEKRPLEHPSLRGADQLRFAREQAERQMAEANASIQSTLGLLPGG